MKFTVDRDLLLDALQRIQSVVEKKNTVQILSNVLCEVKAGKLSLSATDLEVGIKITIPIQSMDKEAGRITLSAKQFLDIVKELPNKPLTLHCKERVEIVSGKSRFNIVSLAASEFPTLPVFEEKVYNKADVSCLNDMVTKTSFAVSNDATRYHLNGVYFEKLEGKTMRMTATDGHRLSFVDNDVFMNGPEFKRGLIIPRKGLAELKKLLDSENSEMIEVSFDRGYFYAHLGECYLFIRLIEGEYPDYRQVIPKEAECVAKVNREELIAALRRVSLLAHEKSKGVKLTLSKNELVITSSQSDMGEAREELAIEYTDDPIEIGFNAKYLLDCLPVIDSEELELRFKDRLSPGIIKGSTKANHTYIVMPMRI